MRSIPSYLPIRTLVRWIENPNSRNPNKVISRTLGKHGFLDNQYTGTLRPEPREHWIVDVVAEINPGRHNGCFVLQPVARIEENSLVLLPPGMYEENNVNGCLIVQPLQRGPHWMLPLVSRQAIKRGSRSAPYAIVVDLGDAARSTKYNEQRSGDSSRPVDPSQHQDNDAATGVL